MRLGAPPSPQPWRARSSLHFALPTKRRVVHSLGQRWRFAKARPEPDLRYLSNATAVFSATNAKYATISHGANFAVCGRSPILVIYQSLLEIARQTDVSLVRGGFRLQNV